MYESVLDIYQPPIQDIQETFPDHGCS